MKKIHSIFYSLVIVSALVIVCFVIFFYTRALNQTISDNVIRSISEIAEHDKSTIQSYIEICWEDLSEIQERLMRSDCRTLSEVGTQLSLECSTNNFSHLCLVAENGAVYADDSITYVSGDGNDGERLDFFSVFEGNADRVITRYDGKILDGWPQSENILYGIRLSDFEVEGVRFIGMLGINDISSIQDKMVIDSFFKDGEPRGHSALIDRNGNYIVNINKEVYQNKQNNLYEHLRQSAQSELNYQELAERLANSETFGFYHSHVGEDYKELFYFIPFAEGIDLYFIMSVNEAVFAEQSRTFVTMSIAMLAASMTIVIAMLAVMMRYQIKTIRTREAARSQKEFLSNMSHEIRTPLNGLIGMNHLIMAHIDDDSQRSQIKEWLQKSHRTAGYLLSLVNDILDMSKLQAGKVDLIQEPLSVAGLMEEIAAMQADNIKSRGVDFSVETDLTEPYIVGDATRIKQILMNIVGNAAKFTPSGRFIRLSVRQERTDDTHVTTIYQCEDGGIGISREYIGKIFDSFSQEQNRPATGIKGTGLGMAISKLLANAMGGDITVESQLEVGSTFTVTIPSVIATDIPDYLREEACADSDGTAPCSGQKDRPLKILVAEDVDLNAEVLLEILSMEGFETAHAANGQEALDLFAQSAVGEFDIILMDMQMPVMDGCSAARKIRRLNRPDASSVTIYACTANTFQEDRALALESGMNDFLSKPVDIGVLLKKLMAGKNDTGNGNG